MAGSRLDGSDRGVALICAIVLFLGMALGSASEASEQDYESRIGVFNDCLSIRNATLEPGTPVTIIRFNSEDENTVSGDTRERRIAARIVAKAELVDDCPIWVEDRILREDSELSLYTISPESPGMLNSVELGIGVLDVPPGAPRHRRQWGCGYFRRIWALRVAHLPSLGRHDLVWRAAME
jgi:hypothetical protein